MNRRSQLTPGIEIQTGFARAIAGSEAKGQDYSRATHKYPAPLSVSSSVSLTLARNSPLRCVDGIVSPCFRTGHLHHQSGFELGRFVATRGRVAFHGRVTLERSSKSTVGRQLHDDALRVVDQGEHALQVLGDRTAFHWPLRRVAQHTRCSAAWSRKWAASESAYMNATSRRRNRRRRALRPFEGDVLFVS